jgi:hypothetical protein
MVNVSDTQNGNWETQAQVDACLRDVSVTEDQMKRWRREGLLPPVTQEPTGYRGSVVHYPPGTCAQIAAAKKLFLEKKRADYVGLQLWRRGFPVAERYWRPRLRTTAQTTDRVLRIIRRLVARSDRDDQTDTLQERAARLPLFARNIIFSRITGRLKTEELGIFFRVLREIGTGEFNGFEAPVSGQERTRDETATIKAFDFDASNRDQVLGTSLKFIDVLPSSLKNLGAVFGHDAFIEDAEASEEEIAKARDDALNGLRIAQAMYDSLKWIYGDQAFGLRFIAWFARKAPDAVVDSLILPMLRLRRVPGAILSSEEIAKLANQADRLRTVSKRLENLWQTDPAFREILDPKRIRRALADTVSLNRWWKEVLAMESESASLKRCEARIRQGIRLFRAGNRLPRNELHTRET